MMLNTKKTKNKRAAENDTRKTIERNDAQKSIQTSSKIVDSIKFHGRSASNTDNLLDVLLLSISVKSFCELERPSIVPRFWFTSL